MVQDITGHARTLPLVRIWMLGPFLFKRRLSDNEHELCYQQMSREEWQGRGKALALLKILLCQRSRRATRDKLMDLLWSESEQQEMKDVRAALKSTAVLLRDILRVGGEESLLLSVLPTDELMLAEQERLWVDADAFETLVQQAVRVLHAQDALPLWKQAHALARGELLADDPYSEWATARRETLHGKIGQCIHALADLYVAQQRLDLAQDLLWNAATTPPVDEDALCRLLALLEQQERYHAAWQLYTHAKQECVKEERHLTPRVYAQAKHIRSKLVAIEPYFVGRGMIPVPAATDVSEVFISSLQLVSSAYGLLIPAALSMSEQTVALDCMTWFSERLAGIIALVTQWHGRLLSIAFQTQLDKELKVFDQMKPIFDPDEYFLSRRSALLVLAALPKGLLGLIQYEQKATFIQGEFLPSCAASITACWYLLNGRELASVEQTLAGYLPQLITWARQPSSYQKTAAHLASQVCLLLGLIASHRLLPQQRVIYCEEAVLHARNAGDSVLLVKAITMLGHAFYEHKHYKEMLQLYQEANYILKEKQGEIPFMLRSKVFTGLALAYAQHGLIQEALNAISEARTIFRDEEDVPVFLSADEGLFSLILHEGWVQLELGKCFPDTDHYMYAAKALAQVEQFPETAFMPERIRIEILNRRAQAEVALGNLDAFRVYTLEGIQGVKQLGSEKRRREVMINYKAARERWPHELKLLEFADLLL